MARTASTNSRMRGFGRDHGWPKRRSMCGRICEPSPRRKRVLRVGVFIQCTAEFTQQSEVADAASDLLHRVFRDAGVHVRTAVGVYQLPKNASVELEMTVAAKGDKA